MSIAVSVAAIVAVLVVGVWAWTLHLRQQARIDAIEGRVAHLLASLSLLTDTTEGGMRDLAAEVARVGTVLAATTRSRARTATAKSPAARRKPPTAGSGDRMLDEDDAIDDGAIGGTHAEVR